MKAIHRNHDRLLALDLHMRGCALRIAIAYLFHVGYNLNDLHSVYDKHPALFDYGMHKRFDLIVGADFKTVVNLGLRGDLLNELIAMFDLQIANRE